MLAIIPREAVTQQNESLASEGAADRRESGQAGGRDGVARDPRRPASRHRRGRRHKGATKTPVDEGIAGPRAALGGRSFPGANSICPALHCEGGESFTVSENYAATAVVGHEAWTVAGRRDSFDATVTIGEVQSDELPDDATRFSVARRRGESGGNSPASTDHFFTGQSTIPAADTVASCDLPSGVLPRNS